MYVQALTRLPFECIAFSARHRKHRAGPCMGIQVQRPIRTGQLASLRAHVQYQRTAKVLWYSLSELGPGEAAGLE
jgi:hypothetical protein